MKILGKDGKEYSTVEECKAAELEFDKQQEEKQKADDAKKLVISKERKELATKIDVASDAYYTALKSYDEAKAKARKLVGDANAEASKILDEAKKKVNEAASEKRNAVIEYNNKFNKPYVKYITGDEAKREYTRIVDEMNDMIDSMFTFNPFKLF